MRPVGVGAHYLCPLRGAGGGLSASRVESRVSGSWMGAPPASLLSISRAALCFSLAALQPAYCLLVIIDVLDDPWPDVREYLVPSSLSTTWWRRYAC